MEFSLLFLVVAGILGAILASFLNALIFRYNTGRSVAHGRSRCMHCGHTLRSLDLVPILSYLFLRGRCRYCHSKVSIQYPLVEVAGVVLAVLLYLQTPSLTAFALALAVWMTLLFIAVYDLRHKIIPWEASGVLAVLALVHLVVNGPSLLAFAAGPLLMLPLFLLSAVSGGRWMGWGDSALELGLGWFLGLTMGLTAFVFAFWIGSVVGIVLAAATRAYTMKSEVPFAPFLILGAAVAYFCHVDIFQTLPALFL